MQNLYVVLPWSFAAPTFVSRKSWSLGYFHTVPDRFLLHFKSCSGTMWTGVRASLRCKNCTVRIVSFRSGSHHNCPLKSQLLTFAWTIHHLPIRGSVAVSAPTKLFRLGLDCFKNLSDTGRSTFDNGAEQSCSGAKIVPQLAFPVWTEALSDTYFATLHFTILYSVNTILYSQVSSKCFHWVSILGDLRRKVSR